MRTRKQDIDAHRIWFEEPDTMMFEVHGDISEEHARRVAAEQIAIAAGRSYLFLLADMTSFKSITAEARRIFSDTGKVMPPCIFACFGTSFRARALAEMLVRAVSLFTTQKHKYRFFESEAAARAYLAELRPEYIGMA